VIPVVLLGFTVLVAHTMAGSYGIALGALGMLSTMTMGLTIDVYGPISDNAGGIAEMCGLGREVRQRTDALDAAGIFLACPRFSVRGGGPLSIYPVQQDVFANAPANCIIRKRNATN